MNIRNDRGIIKWLLIGLCAIFLIVALVLPLVYVIVTALRDGWNEYVTAISDTYAVKSILLTLKVVAHNQIHLPGQKDHINAHRSATYHIPDHRGSYIRTYIWQAELPVSIP